MSPPVAQVAMASDARYLPWCATAMLSCLESTPELHLEFHLLHEGDLSADDRRRLTALVARAGGDIAFHLIESTRLASLPSKGAALGGRISWGRVLLPELLDGVDRAVYLDADVLAMTSIAPLWNTPLDGLPIAAVRNVVEPALHAHVRGLGIGDAHDYFNAGVLVMDLDAMRDADALDGITRFVASRHGDLTWFDQDALNVVFAGRWRALAPRWNAMNSLWTWTEWAEEAHGAAEVYEAMTNPAILHFEGPAVCKPWHQLSVHAFRDRYRATLARTPWRNEPLLERTRLNRLISRLPEPAWVPAYLRVERSHAALQRWRARAGRVLRRATGTGTQSI
jgi:lipopolysaccharide biosynthesis glycosyltransferase